MRFFSLSRIPPVPRWALVIRICPNGRERDPYFTGNVFWPQARNKKRVCEGVDTEHLPTLEQQ